MNRGVFRGVTAVLGAAALLAAAKVSVDLARMVALEAAGPMHGDAGTYALLGRGLINGLIPYVDLFDAKPAGIYLLMALSQLLTGGEMLATWLQIATFILTPLLCALFAFRADGADARSLRTWIIASVAFAGGALFTLYTEERSGMLQPEGFGYFFSIVYALLLFRTNLKSRWSIAGASVAMLFSIGMKEPFLVVNLSIALLLSKSWRDLPRTFLLPLAIAMIAGAAMLWFLGILGAYTTVHLPNMLKYRTQIEEYNPMWLRGLNTDRIYGNIVEFYPTGRFTGWLIIFLWICAPLLLERARQRWTVVLLTWLAFLGSMQALYYLYAFVFLAANHPGTSLLLTTADYFWLIGAIVGFAGLWLTERSFLPRVFLALLVLYLAVFSVGIGAAYHPNFFVFAVPLYVVLLLLWVRSATTEEAGGLVFGGIVLLTVVAGFLYRPNPAHLKDARDMTKYNYASSRENAAHLDALLDACDYDRYVAAVGNSGFWFAKHSPWGPLPGLNLPRYFPPDHPYSAQMMETLTQKTQIILFDAGEAPRLFALFPALYGNFVAEAPDCAKPYLPFQDYTVLFRKKT